MSYTSHRGRALARLTVFCLGTSALTGAVPSLAAVIDYPNGSNNSSPIVLTDNSTQLQVLTGSATQSGLISESGGSFGLEKIGAGTLVLTANETYTGATTISGGTLQVGNGGASGFIGGNIIDNGVLVSNTSSFTQFGGISGSGSLIKNGTGTLVLYSGNSFTGGTVVNSGSIFANGLSALPGNITDNASIEFALNGDFASGNTITYSGAISGTGSVDFNGTGKLILASPQTYTGGTTLEFLTLQLGAGGSLPSTGAVTLGGGTLDLNGFSQTIGALSGFGSISLGSATLTTNSDTNTTTTAHITGSGGLTKGGTGTLTLSAFNGYTGVTTISGGAIALGTNGPDSGSLAGNVIDNAQLIFNRSDSYTFAGVISGTGQVSQTGAGKTTLTAVNTYIGGTTISSGALNVLGSINASTTNVQSGGTLEGTGTVGSVTVQGGGSLVPGNPLAAPDSGNSLGTLTVNGNLTLAAGATYGALLGYGPTSGWTFAKAAVTGTSSIAGILSLDFPGYSGIYARAGQYTLISSGGSLSGSFSNVDASGLAGSGFHVGGVSYDAHDVYLSIVRDTFVWSATPGSSDWATASNWQNGAVPEFDVAYFGATSRPTVSIGPFTGSAASLVFQAGAPAYSFTIANPAARPVPPGFIYVPPPPCSGTCSVSAPGVVVNWTDGIVDNSSNPPSFLVGGVFDPSYLNFVSDGNAADATITAAAFGTVTFEGNSDAGPSARLITMSGGTFDFSQTSGPNGDNKVSAGSIAGAGFFVLGNKNLTVGSLNTSTEVSGIISGDGGSLTKVGTGTLTLSGANTYAGGTTISAGTIQIGNGGTSGSIIGNVTDNGIFTINRSNSYSFAGSISGTGAFQQLGTGTTILTGANTYSGGTTIAAGSTLQIGNGGTSGTLPDLTAFPFWVANNGTLIFNRSDTSIFHNIVNGNGAIVKQGAGTLIVDGTLNASNITISAGALQFGNGAEDGFFNASVTNNAQLIFGYNANFISHIGNVISGSGTVSLTGGGGVIYEAAQTYTGGTIVSSGTLQLGTGGSLASTGALTINGGIFDLNGHTQTVGALSGTGGAITLGAGNLTTNSSANTSLATVISGSGSVTKLGAGALSLSGANLYTGVTTVSAGTLNVTGSIASSSVSVASGATLTGTGKVGATSVASGGTLTPGASATPGTLTIGGNLTLAAGSNFADAISSSAAGLASVGGTASLNGNALANFASGSYANGQRYTLITAAGGIGGTFTSLATTGLPANLRGSLSYDANDVYLNLKPNALAPSLASDTTTNQHNVVAAIDAAVLAGAAPSGGFNALYNLSGPALNSAIDQISGQIGPNVSNAVGQNFLSFLAMAAEGGAGDMGSYAPGSAYGAADAPHRAQLDGGETRVWGAGYGGHVGLSADAATGAAALSESNAGLIGGADIELADHLLAGVTLGWGREHFNSGNGSGTSTDYAVGLYGRADLDEAYVTAAFGYSWHQIATLRVITVSGTDVLQGKQNADDYGGRIEAGWRMVLDDAYTIAPYAAFAGESFASPAYAETALSGAPTFALTYAAHSSTLGRSELGAHLDRSFELGNGGLTADIRAAWAHQLDDQPFTQASFESLPTAGFQVLGVRSTRDAALLGVDLELQYASGLFLGLKGEGQFGAGMTVVEGLGSFGMRW
jgi:autotransporter-associated beta strand protein